MTTAEAIEGITDAGNFEVLATRVLRLIDEDCRLVEHFGVNAKRKTISNPVDAFCKVPGSLPPRFIMLAFTTDKRDSLERKWLYDHSRAKKPTKATEADDGDLIKAARKAVEVRGDHPNAVFIIWLCTNKRLDDELLQAVYAKAREHELEVKLLAQSTLRDFLDLNPEGQWLRKEHLSIEADRLSLSLLQHLSRRSVDQLGNEFLLLDPSQFIPTRQRQELIDNLENSAFSMLLLAGPSGFGKSVLCYQSLQGHVDGGGSGLWISGEVAEQSNSLAEAITKTVQSLHPTIEPNAGTIALQLCSTRYPLILVVDDINRSANPASTLKKLLGRNLRAMTLSLRKRQIAA